MLNNDIYKERKIIHIAEIKIYLIFAFEHFINLEKVEFSLKSNLETNMTVFFL